MWPPTHGMTVWLPFPTEKAVDKRSLYASWVNLVATNRSESYGWWYVDAGGPATPDKYVGTYTLCIYIWYIYIYVCVCVPVKPGVFVGSTV